MKSFAVVLAALVAAAQGQIALPAAGLPLAGYPAVGALPAGFAAAGALPAGYAGHPFPLNAGLNFAPGVYAHHAGLPLAAQPLAQPLVQAVLPATPKTYAVPPARIVENPAHVETISEKVEQHGYKIKY